MYLCHIFLFASLSVFSLSSALFPHVELDRSRVTIDVNTKSGEFDIYIEGKHWFSSGPVFFRAKNKLYTTADGSLVLVGGVVAVAGSGVDVIGPYDTITMRYENDQGEAMVASIKIYESALVFGQTFPIGLENTSSGNEDGVITGFPSFRMGEKDRKLRLGYAHWLSFYHMEDTPTMAEKNTTNQKQKKIDFYSPLYGHWDVTSVLPGGIGGSGVTGVFDASEYDSEGRGRVLTAMLSPYNSFMAASQYSPVPGVRVYGIMGNVTEIPAGYCVQTLLYVSGGGITATVLKWGELLRRSHGTKKSSTSSGDITLNYMGVSTDNGAFYYYNTAPSLDYEDTMVAVKQYSDAVRIPYRYWLLDSWWYYQDGGVSDWQPMADVFPDGMEGLYATTGMLVQAHNRYWSGHAVYARQNGGKYLFLIDEDTGHSLPLEQAFWDELLGRKARWGLRVYEQDWLKHQMDEKTPALMQSVHLADMWLTQMARAAEKNGLTIQYCMAYMRFLLQAVLYPSVTQTRASGDYLDDSEQWRIGAGSPLLWALGLSPSKDGLWSTSQQPGNPYGSDVFEPAPRLQAAVAALSAGPLAVGDKIGISDTDLIMRCCRADGRLLHPSTPAMSLDAVTIQASLGGASKTPRGPQGEVWAARSIVIGIEIDYTYLFVADLQYNWMAFPRHIGYPEGVELWGYESNSTSDIFYFSNDAPLQLQANDLTDFSLYSFVPIQYVSGVRLWSVQGELDKWVSLSPARFTRISTSSTSARAVVQGMLGERLTVGFIDTEGEQVVVQCVFDERASLTVKSDGQCL